jgi:hypothetical protein
MIVSGQSLLSAGKTFGSISNNRISNTATAENEVIA